MSGAFLHPEDLASIACYLLGASPCKGEVLRPVEEGPEQPSSQSVTRMPGLRAWLPDLGRTIPCC